MKKYFEIIIKNSLLIFLFFTYLNYGQIDKLNGKWILDKINYNDGSSLEINHPMYSDFLEYTFNNNTFTVNDITFDVEIDNNKISNIFRTMNYRFINDKLIINELGDNKTLTFIKRENFTKIYPEFEPKSIEYDNKIVYLPNSIVKPDFIYSINKPEKKFYSEINSYLVNSIKLENDTEGELELKFIITKDNKIYNVKVIKGISKDFDDLIINNLMKSEKYFKNNFDKDFILTFIWKINVKELKKDRKIDKLLIKSREYYKKNDFLNVIKNYDEIISNNDLNIINKNLDNSDFFLVGISYIALNQIDKSCEIFKKIGDKSNFKIRNYLINFCNN
ncbi:MAG: hypothetical protein ACOVQ2_05950 [Flavobacterium sp.]